MNKIFFVHHVFMGDKVPTTKGKQKAVDEKRR